MIKKAETKVNTSETMYKYSLGWQWISLNLPDVAEAIMVEVRKEFPHKPKRVIELPESIRTLKIGTAGK